MCEQHARVPFFCFREWKLLFLQSMCRALRGGSVLCLMGSGISAGAQSAFTDAERAALQTYWNAVGRYRCALPADAARKGPWQVRLTPEGSAWLLKYQTALGASKIPPTQDPTALATPSAGWRAWVQAKLAYDRQQAQEIAKAANAAFASAVSQAGGNTAQGVPGAGDTAVPLTSPPGVIPPDLLMAAGDPPALAAAVVPMQHTITFDDGDVYQYTDHTIVSPAYPYYRFAQGVAFSNGPLNDNERAPLFAAAGMTPSEQRIATAVSRLEGSFDAVNTYDTGYVSVGFLQFITLDDGRHSLCEVLQREKTEKPGDFAQDFHRYGIDISANGSVVTVDPATGAELSGPDAVRSLIDDKRLIAVFQRAGKRSDAFRIAQIEEARARYWPSEDPIVVTIQGVMLTGKVSDVISSEAGLATLFDRKINRGTLLPLNDVIAHVMEGHREKSLAAASKYEREIVEAMRYRVDFLKDKSLSQPK